MSLQSCARRRISVLKRNFSSDTSSKSLPHVQSHRSLPSAKMRALISLYHQTETFVTPENLQDRIDQTFASEDPNDLLQSTSDFISFTDLKDKAMDLREAPKMSQWNPHANTSRRTQVAGKWSHIRRRRELKIIEALYGVDVTHSGNVMPGLEVLEESAETLMKNEREDMEREEEELEAVVRR